MNTGTISSRYAKALLLFAQQSGEDEIVCRQAGFLLKSLTQVPAFRKVIDDPSVGSGEKLSLMDSALGEGKMAESLRRFMNLLIKNRRIQYLVFMLDSYIDLYYKSRNLLFGKLVTVVESPKLENTLAELVKSKIGKDVVIETKTDPSIIGGFVFTVDDERIDASIATQLSTLRKQFVDKNRRIV